MKCYHQEEPLSQNTYSHSSKSYASKLENPLGYGFSQSGNMVLGPSVRTITLPCLDIPRVLEVRLSWQESHAPALVVFRSLTAGQILGLENVDRVEVSILSEHWNRLRQHT